MTAQTFLQLCQQTIDDAGISGTITNTVGQVGEFGRVVGWVARATTEIEGLYFDFNFLHVFMSINTIVGVRDYPAPSDLNLWDKKTFVITEDEQPIEYIDWTQKKLDPSLSIDGDPFLVTALPSKALRFYDTPIRVQAIATQYWIKPTELVDNADEPKIPTQFRDIIVYKALQYYANFESADETKIAGIEQYGPRLTQLLSSELPSFRASGSTITGTDIVVSVPRDDQFEDFI